MSLFIHFSNYLPEIIGAIICVLSGMLSGIATQPTDYVWYAQLSRPSFTPPNWVFAPVWTFLYCCLGIVAGQLWKKRREHRRALFLFGGQFILNLAWSPLFFVLHRPDIALLDLGAMLTASYTLFWITRHEKAICIPLIPYICWISLAFTLNTAIVLLNR